MCLRYWVFVLILIFSFFVFVPFQLKFGKMSTTTDSIVKNIVIVGDGAVGKTCLLYAYSNQGEFCLTYIPTMWVAVAHSLRMQKFDGIIFLFADTIVRKLNWFWIISDTWSNYMTRPAKKTMNACVKSFTKRCPNYSTANCESWISYRIFRHLSTGGLFHFMLQHCQSHIVR